MIKDLRRRLKDHRPLTPPLEGVAFEYGFNSKHLDSWVNYWAEQYDFTKREAFLNKYPHYKTYIQGLDIHFIRVKPQVTNQIIIYVYCMIVYYYFIKSIVVLKVISPFLSSSMAPRSVRFGVRSRRLNKVGRSLDG
jgi:hypothetical protein